MEPTYNVQTIRAIIGLGNPGSKYAKNRHNIGFRVVDELVAAQGGNWQTADNMVYAVLRPAGASQDVYIIKPQTYMNDSGRVLPWLAKKGIKADQILVIHDELEKKFGQVLLKFGGSHKGHNGLKSLIGMIGADFWRLKFGIDRPADREEVPNYVLANFPGTEEAQIPGLIDQAARLVFATN